MKNFVCVMVPLNERTRHLIGRRELALLGGTPRDIVNPQVWARRQP